MVYGEVLIKGGHVVDPATGLDGRVDILIKGGKIQTISKDIEASNGTRVIDATSKYVIPGLIDCHVHLREPGLEHKETIETGSRAAAIGGYTTLICEPNTAPPIDSLEMVESFMKRVYQKSVVHIYTKACITKGLLGEELTDIDRLATDKRVRALSDDGNPVFYEPLMKKACELASRNKLVISPHCEDSQISLEKAKENTQVAHFPGKPFCHETDFVLREIKCTEQARGWLHVSHVSLKSTLEAIKQAKERNIAKISCEVTPHHLLLDETFRDANGNVPKTNPPLRTREDREALLKSLLNGVVDVIATDHAPHTQDDIKRGASGLIGLENALGVILTKLVHPGILSLKEVVRKMSTNPARIFNVPGGSLAVGMPADIAIIDMDKEWTVEAGKFESKSRNCPFQGWKLRGQVVSTIVGGKVIVDNGKIAC
ncbi:Dihydroorotase [Candidatus Brocadiaceae bacterium B188]|nr:dihydroorotase [Candidatus Brocadia sapporoensis]QQR66763.1 MAG: dihydroorotase [Candidatus Brocadia sp.]RZV59273.1 MAG: dihydroorotase [Candidatus Brocadia sp. BROELEC01]TWU53723.1 Dihydroorotase [Candidatus Brocadiaceae bacterium B188]